MADENENENEQSPGDLRALVKKLSKQVEEAEARAAAATTGLRERKLAEVLTAKKVPVKLSKFMADVDADDPSSVDGWLKENADAFGFTLEAEQTPAEKVGEESVLSEEEQHAIELMQVFQTGASTAPPDKLAKIASVPDSDNLDELHAAILAAGK